MVKRASRRTKESTALARNSDTHITSGISIHSIVAARNPDVSLPIGEQINPTTPVQFTWTL